MPHPFQGLDLHVHVGEAALIIHIQAPTELNILDQQPLELEVAPFQKRTLSVGEVVHASCDLQFPVGRVSSFDDGTLVVDWETPLWIRTDGSSHVIIVQLDAMPMRLIGKSREVSDFSHQ